jgi:EpsI family protein
MIARTAVVVSLLLGTAAIAARTGTTEAGVTRQSLRELPEQLAQWRGSDAAPFDDDVLATLGVDDYINRQYVRGGSGPVGVYVGYYASQRQGDTIHSPENCLPGAGWRPIETSRPVLNVGAQSLRVNRFLIQKGLDRQVVLYWYQGRGRVIANEYANKAWLMLDAVRLHRTDGGLVRLIAPVVTTTEAADRELKAFVTVLFPALNRYLP